MEGYEGNDRSRELLGSLIDPDGWLATATTDNGGDDRPRESRARQKWDGATSSSIAGSTKESSAADTDAGNVEPASAEALAIVRAGGSELLNPSLLESSSVVHSLPIMPSETVTEGVESESHWICDKCGRPNERTRRRCVKSCQRWKNGERSKWILLRQLQEIAQRKNLPAEQATDGQGVSCGMEIETKGMSQEKESSKTSKFEPGNCKIYGNVNAGGQKRCLKPCSRRKDVSKRREKIGGGTRTKAGRKLSRASMNRSVAASISAMDMPDLRLEPRYHPYHDQPGYRHHQLTAASASPLFPNEEPWKCDKCGNLNPADQMRCALCRSEFGWKDGGEVTARATNEDEWQCSCGRTNPASAGRCKKPCFLRKKGGTTGNGTESSSDSESESSWGALMTGAENSALPAIVSAPSVGLPSKTDLATVSGLDQMPQEAVVGPATASATGLDETGQKSPTSSGGRPLTSGAPAFIADGSVGISVDADVGNAPETTRTITVTLHIPESVPVNDRMLTEASIAANKRLLELQAAEEDEDQMPRRKPRAETPEPFALV